MKITAGTVIIAISAITLLLFFGTWIYLTISH